LNNVNNIAENQNLVNRKSQKSYKLFTILHRDYVTDNNSTFFRNGKMYLRRSVRAFAQEIGCSVGLVNKKLTWAKNEGYIEYGFINSDGNRKHIHERMCIFFTPKGRVWLRQFAEKKPDNSDKNSKGGKTVNDNYYTAVNKNNLYIYKSSNEDVFKKFNNSLVAKAWYELRKRGYLDKITAGKSRYLHAFLKFIGENCDSYEKFYRLRNYLNWVEDTLGKISLHRLLNFKLFRKFFANLTQEITQRERLKYEQSAKSFQNNFKIISNNSLESIKSILENMEFLRFNTVV